jgi:hypothetical protein
MAMSDAAALANWTFEQDGADWVGHCTVNGRRTALKGSEAAARKDAAAGRVVCRQWPDCEHWSADECAKAIVAARRQRRAAA